jgi:hypothetical protein
VVITLFIFRWVKQQPANKRWQYMMIIVGVVLLGLVASGKLPLLFALIGALIPALQRIISLIPYLPMLKRVAGAFSSNTPSSGQQSHVETDYLKMELDHDSGKLTGKIKSGLLSGRDLDDLDIDELLQLRQYYTLNDEDSRLLLENYIDRTHGTSWRSGQEDTSQSSRTTENSNLSEQEAYAILGLEPGADKQAITKAHKRLMQKLHPDRGGSSYLATKINQAKDLLLNQHSH